MTDHTSSLAYSPGTLIQGGGLDVGTVQLRIIGTWWLEGEGSSKRPSKSCCSRLLEGIDDRRSYDPPASSSETSERTAGTLTLSLPVRGSSSSDEKNRIRRGILKDESLSRR